MSLTERADPPDIKRREIMMAKKSKAPKQTAVKKTPKTEATQPAAAQHEAKDEKGRPMLRAIRVTPELLEAAKAYKKSTGVSFYALGLEAIGDRLVKEGFLTKAG